MRKLKLQVQISVDGYIGGPNGEMDWLEWNWGDDIKQYVGDITESIDTIVLGRKLAEGFIPYWAGIAANADDPQQSAGKKFTDTPKVVFTKTLEKAAWNNTVLAKGNLFEEINKLKQQEGGDIFAYGGAAFVSALIKENLIDEYHFLFNPTILGNGLPIFKEVSAKQNLKLIKSVAFDCGIVALNYELKRD